MASSLINLIIRRSLSSTSAINHVTIVGGGLMGSGIAQVAAQTGHNVTLVDLDATLLEKAKKSIGKNLERVANKQFKGDTEKINEFVTSSIARIEGTTDVKEAAAKTDLVIEAIVENLEAKQKLFSSIDSISSPSTIFASNTSSISIGEIAKSTKRLDRFIGIHFFNPVPVMKLVEIIRTSDTSDETYKSCLSFGEKLGKTCITCKDTFGFVVNRLIIPYTAEAMRMHERGDASIKDIDIAMKLGAGYPMGPFELSDLVGLDTFKNALGAFERCEPDNPLYKPVQLVQKYVDEGKLGMKSGEGFYKYKK